MVHSTKLIPPLGTGDHDLVHHELKINLGRRHQNKRPIKLYKKTDWAGFRNEMKDYQNTYQVNFSTSDTNTKWSEFKTTLNKMTGNMSPPNSANLKMVIPG